MIVHKLGRLFVALLILFGVFLSACTPFASPYSAEAFRQATTIKAQSLALIKDATDDFKIHEARADALLINISEAYEFARGRGSTTTDVAASQWSAILDPNGGSVGGFISQWREKGRMSEFFIDQFSEVIALQFDSIIELETGRNISLEEK